METIMTAPIIGITVSRNFENHQFYNQNPSAYSEAIVLAGGLPLLIPVEFPVAQITKISSQIDGLLISGGDDVDYLLYGGEPHPTIEGICEERDQLEIELLKCAMQTKKPVLGICRGIQLINVALGGTLYTHLPEHFKTDLIHNTPQEKGRSSLVHEVELDSNSKLGRIIGLKQFQVNSFHHQAIQIPAPDLRVTARATDGLIEAVELANDPFGVIGVQWHPECLLACQSQRNIFKAFIDACQV
jgi:putative glutamine amidotransferase